ncbi:MAG: IS1634 family transposase [Chloroflexi bacterium]|nr:MAG: IS1634 family transposase [Chloroflexota bacterium]
MFIRELKNRSGSISIQIINKEIGRYKVVKTVGCATMLQDVEKLKQQARQYIKELSKQYELFESKNDRLVESVFESLSNSSIRTVGPELIFGKIFDHIGFNRIDTEMFRHLVISRLAFPLSKLKTAEYLYRYQGVLLDIDSIYRFLDKLNNKLKEQVEKIAFEHTKKLMGGTINIVFYDMTTLYFESSDEDDLRKTGFSKDGKHQNPQIYIGLLVSLGGYPIGYDIFEGNTYEGHTLIPFLEKMSHRFKIGKPVVIADAGLLSNSNIEKLESKGYQYIVGARIKNDTDQVKEQILSRSYSDGSFYSINKGNGRRLIIHYSNKRATKDAYNRKRGLKRLEKRIKSGRLTKSNINNRGYNKYLKLEGNISIEIDYDKFEKDKQWDGLKGYITNTSLSDKEVVENYKNLWHIERTFRMSKTDLRIRPIFHRLRHRIEAHICISFVAYSILKELERALYESHSSLSLKKATEVTHNMYRIDYQLPDSKQFKSKLLKMDNEQIELYKIIQDNF